MAEKTALVKYLEGLCFFHGRQRALATARQGAFTGSPKWT